MYQIHHTPVHFFNHSPPSPTPIPGVVSTSIIFAFTCMCTHVVLMYSCVHHPISFPQHLPLLHWEDFFPLGRPCCALLSSGFAEAKREKIKNKTF
jgi:hypothetical protein